MPRRTDAHSFGREELSPLKRRLVATGKTDEEIAKIMGVSKSTVSKWCSGTHFPHPSHIKKLARIVAVSPLELTRIIQPEHSGSSAA
jgi:transcriptional regulator with XRE-family HTH domain